MALYRKKSSSFGDFVILLLVMLRMLWKPSLLGVVIWVAWHFIAKIW